MNHPAFPDDDAIAGRVMIATVSGAVYRYRRYGEKHDEWIAVDDFGSTQSMVDEPIRSDGLIAILSGPIENPYGPSAS
jgi:hypothetical protein